MDVDIVRKKFSAENQRKVIANIYACVFFVFSLFPKENRTLARRISSSRMLCEILPRVLPSFIDRLWSSVVGELVVLDTRVLATLSVLSPTFLIGLQCRRVSQRQYQNKTRSEV